MIILIILIFFVSIRKRSCMAYDIFLISLATYFFYIGYVNNNSCRYRNSIYDDQYNCQCDSKCSKNNDCCSDFKVLT